MSQQAAPTDVREKHPLSTLARRRQPLEGLHRQIDRLLSEFGQYFAQPLGQSMSPREPLWWHGVPWGTTAPIVDVTESEKNFELTAELPGVDTQDVEVKVSNDTLSIKGEKQEAKKQQATDYRLRERHFSPFERQFALSADIDLNKIEATLKNGLLTVTLPKKPEAQKSQPTGGVSYAKA